MSAEARCPVCETPISQTRYAEIQAKIRTEEQAKLAVQAEQLRAQYQAELKVATERAAQATKQELELTLAEAKLQETQLTERVGQLEAREATLRAAHEELTTTFTRDLAAATESAANQAREAALVELGAKDAEVRALRATQEEFVLRHTRDLAASTEIAAKEAREAMRAEVNAKDTELRTLKATQQEIAAKFARDLASATDAATQTRQEALAAIDAKDAEVRKLRTAQQELTAQFARDLASATDATSKQVREAVAAELAAKDAEARSLKDAHTQELKQQRETLDEHRDSELQKVRVTHARENEQLQKRVQELNRKLEQKTAHELGEFAEVDLYRALCDAFQGDRIRRVQKGESGADIVHEIMHNGQFCTTLIYDSKNRRIWHNTFVQKLLIDQANAKAEHAILVTSVFPSGKRDLCASDGVILAKPSQVVTIATLLRNNVIADHVRNLSFKDRTEKKERLYGLISSELFRQRMSTVERACRDLEKMDVDEADAHRKVWNKRNALYKSVDKSVHDLVTDVNVILEGASAAGRNAATAATGTADRFSF